MIEAPLSTMFILYVYMGSYLPALSFSTHQDCSNALTAVGSMLAPGGLAYCVRERDGVVTARVMVGDKPIGWTCPGYDAEGNFTEMSCAAR